MKILLIHNYYQYRGGEETYVESLKKLLEDSNHEVYLYSKHSNAIKTIWDKVIIAIKLFWNEQTNRELTKIIHDFKPDVAHFNNIYPLIGATAYHVCKKNKIKIVQTIHNYRFMCPKGILFRNGKICELCVKKRFFSPAVLFSCYHSSRFASLYYALAFYIHKNIGTFSFIDTYIFPSLFTQKYYEKYFGILKSKSVYLPHFIDLKTPEKKEKREDWYLYVGRLSEEKGIIDLLEIFKTTPYKKLKVIGTGPLKKQVNKYKIYDNINILGFMPRNEILPILQKTKALYVPSKWYEVSPFVILEALVLKTPLITSQFLKQNFTKNKLTGRFYISSLLKFYS